MQVGPPERLTPFCNTGLNVNTHVVRSFWVFDVRWFWSRHEVNKDMNDVDIDLGSTLPFLYEKFLALIGKDKATQELHKWFADVEAAAIAEASTVQCIGMHQPLPIAEIYQPTKLLWQNMFLYIPTATGRSEQLHLPSDHVSPQKFLSTPTSAIIYAGPGWGKTTFLHHLFMQLLSAKDMLPVLFTLRRPEALTNLFQFVESLDKVHKIAKRPQLLLLVDGYDEIGTIDRKRVSDVLLKYMSSGHGRFYLTCRDFYDVYEINAPAIRIAPFDRVDQERYVQSFSRAYGAKIDAAQMIGELESRGLGDLLAHSLLLALACIVKGGPMSFNSRSVMGLIERAIDTLSFRWDEAKGISREARLPLDGKDRIKCLMRIAFGTRTLELSSQLAERAAQEQLDLLRWDDVNAIEVLRETARFYGIFVPISDRSWAFVHKTLHDYLAAKFWVESGRFDPKRVSDWDARAAYAACLTADATESMLDTLRERKTLAAFAEMLSNDASFNHSRVGTALLEHYEREPHFHEYTEPNRVSVQLNQDFITIASSKFLLNIIGLVPKSETNS
jgi:hypothetical protein